MRLEFLVIFSLFNIRFIRADAEWMSDSFTCYPSLTGDITKCNYAQDDKILYVNFKEEIHHVLNLAFINCKDCNDAKESKPKVGTFSFGSNSLLGANIAQIENKWVLQITKKQDYEMIDERSYKFEIAIGDGEDPTRSVMIQVVDIDDNPPRITVNQLPCSIPENYEGFSKCTYHIEDPDEVNDITKVTFYLDPKKLEENFKPVLIPIKGSASEADAKLKVIKSLDFETNPVYYYTMHSKDDMGVEDQAKIIIEVIDMDDQPPKWIQIFATKTFNEKTKQKFTVLALDGDIQINTTIDYKLDPDCHKSITVHRVDTGYGIINVEPINRDILDNDFVACKLTAYQLDNLSMEAVAEITMILIDINDNAPIITPKEYEEEIDEADFATLKQVFTINDIDEGKNAQYDVELYSDGDETFHQAFQIMPTTGYKLWKFTVSVAHPELLDYDIEKWRKFDIHIKSFDGLNEDKSTIHIKLRNMNNKIPIFDPPSYKIELKETVPADTKIVTIKATDADFGDSVVYDLCMESQKEIFSIDSITGDIKTIHDNTFDYSKQTEVIIQVLAHDTFEDGKHELHTVTTQVLVNVIDVNDKKPRILLPNYSPEIKENEPDETVVTKDLKAEDVDTHAELEFSIDWSKTWATKQGQKVEQKEFEDVFKIDTVFDDPNKKGYATGILKVAEVLKLDYEKYEVIYLFVIIKNVKQEVNDGTDTATLTVTLIDVNDNPPIFNNDTINSKKTVDENSRLGTLISTVTATDADGPNYNVITYSIKPIKNTKSNLVKIDPKTGALIVEGNIDADKPPTFYLYYHVIASDGELYDTREIKIYINDLNDEKPRLKTKLKPMSIPEGQKDESLQIIDGIDDDRDSPHNLVSYYLNINTHNELSAYFKVNEETGEIRVHGYIDRDAGQTHFEIFVILRDNRGGEGVTNEDNTPSFSLTITDVNNKRPILPDIDLPDISENDEKGKEIIKIYADDKDEPCTDNTRIDYKIINITDKEGLLSEIFDIKSSVDPKDTLCKYFGILKIGKPLQSHYGALSIAIKTTDRGVPKLSDEHIYPINIKPYNYYSPTILFPKNDEEIILRKDQTVGERLITIDNRPLQEFKATDNQNNKFHINFDLVENENIFEIDIEQLQLKKLPTQDVYNLKVEAKHDGTGNASSSVINNFKVLFIDTDALPEFTKTKLKVSFLENEYNRSVIPKAVDPKCYSKEKKCPFQTYYYILKGDEHHNFSIDVTNPDEPELLVVATLDRESIDFYTLTIVATNDKKPPVNVPDNQTPLTVSVTVLDENDNPPVFTKKLFSGSMTVADKPDRTVIELLATDVDTVDEGKLTYYILKDTIKISDPSLDHVKSDPFQIKKVNNIVSNFQVIKEMKGHFQFTAEVRDSNLVDPSHRDHATVKIYIISDDNRVDFTFKNDIEKVVQENSYIEQVFSDVFKYKCTIDETYKKADDSGKTLPNQTNVKTHFIKDEEPVEKNTIIVKASDLETISALRLKFLDHHLNFADVPKPNEEEKQNMEKLLLTLLIVVSVVLGTLCIVLLLIFCIKTRTLKKRLSAMTTNEFGSTKSDLNRVGINAPGTNKHAFQTNPVWNENLDDVIKDEDAISQGSGGSDLIGIEDNPEFLYLPNTISDDFNTNSSSIKRKSLNPMANVSPSVPTL